MITDGTSNRGRVGGPIGHGQMRSWVRWVNRLRSYHGDLFLR